MKKLLLISPVNFFPPRDGIGQAIYFRYKYLSLKFEIDLVFLGLSPDDSKLVDLKTLSKLFQKIEIFPSDLQPSLRFNFKNFLRKLNLFLFTKIPFHVSRSAPLFYVNDIKEMIKKNNYDRIIMEDIFAFNIMRKIGDQILNRCICVLHAYPSEQRLLQFKSNNIFQQIYRYNDFYKMILFEKMLFSQLNKIVCISYDDTEKINSRYHFQKVKYCPIVLEPQWQLRKNNYRIDSHAKIIFMAPSYSVNEKALDWFLLEVIPQIKNDFELYLIGSICNYHQTKYALKENIKLIGFCENEKKLELLLQSDIFINPIKHGTGVKMKNIEAMSLGLPVITTSVGVYGLERDWDESIIVADKPAEFANAIDKLILSEDKRKELGNNGYQYFIEHFSPENTIKKWEEILGI